MEESEVPPLSSTWREHVVDLARGLSFGTGSVVVQQLVHDDVDGPAGTFQVFEHGHLVAWEAGVLPETGFALVQDRPSASRYAAGELWGNAALAATTIREVWDGVARTSPPPPLDRSLVEPDLAVVPAATLDVQQHEERTPFGTVSFCERFVDGRRTAWSLGVAEQTELTMWRQHRAVAEWLVGERSIVGSYEGGELDGRWTWLMLVGGLLGTPAYRATTSFDARTLLGLATYGELVSSPAYRQVLAEVAGAPAVAGGAP